MENPVSDGRAIVSVDPKLYPMDVIYSAAYAFTEKAYITLSGDPETKVMVELLPKKNEDAGTIKKEFGNELLSYAFYKTQAEKTGPIRNMIIQRALMTNTEKDPTAVPEGVIEEWKPKESFVDDPEGIAVPWDVKYKKTEEK